MDRSPADTLAWMREGHRLWAHGIAGLEAGAWEAGSVLPGWTRRHLVAHVAANADALGNLVRWAATGVETPMYASPEERARGIEQGARLDPADLAAWSERSATALADALDRLTGEQWEREIRTAQGRVLPATEIPWLRAREACVHAVDLGAGLGFADLPEAFLAALVADITDKRGEIPDVRGPLPEVAAWLAGRPHSLPDAPALGPWL